MFVPLVGIPWFFLYYFTFRFVITRFNFKTPGREDAGGESVQIAAGERPQQVIVALGGKENIVELDCCATRLRVTLQNGELLDEGLLKETGARAVIKRGNGVQVIYGPHVTIIKNEVEEILAL
jgi:PTS system maltose and glucose-specific IIC component